MVFYDNFELKGQNWVMCWCPISVPEARYPISPRHRLGRFVIGDYINEIVRRAVPARLIIILGMSWLCEAPTLRCACAG